MKTAFITGLAGFVGRHFSDRLESQGWSVVGVDTAWDGTSDAFNWFLEDGTQYDLVIHAAASGPNRAAIDKHHEHFPYNVMLDSAMFNWVLRTAQPRVIYLSSCAVYPAILQSAFMSKRLKEDFVGYDKFHLSEAFPFGVDPTPIDRYGWTKLIGEHMARAVNEAGGTFVTVVRPFSGYGSDQALSFPFRTFIERAKRREDPFPVWGTGDQVRDWIHIDDVVDGALALVEAKVTAPVNLCTGLSYSMRTVIKMITSQVGYEPLIQPQVMESHGADNRVGDPTLLHSFYTPRVSLQDGIARALKGE